MEYFIDGLRISDKRIHQLAIDSKGLQGDIDCILRNWAMGKDKVDIR